MANRKQVAGNPEIDPTQPKVSIEIDGKTYWLCTSGIGGVLGGLGSLFQGFFADGEDVTANRPSIVGERGAELFIPHTSGTIMPNHKLKSADGDVHHHTYDLKNAADPREKERRIERAMMAYHGSAVRGGMMGTREECSGGLELRLCRRRNRLKRV